MIEFHVSGTPAPQGSKKAFVVKGRAVLVESSKEPVKNWRDDVRSAAEKAVERVRASIREDEDAVRELLRMQAAGTPVRIALSFFMRRPAHHYRTGRYSHLLRDNAPIYCARRPDFDKLERATCDALTSSGIYGDDSQVADCHTTKRYANGMPGALIRLEAISEGT